MGTSRNAQQFHAKMVKASDGLGNAGYTTANGVALGVKTSVLANATAATGGDLRLSGTGNRKLGAGYKVGKRSSGSATAVVFARGPMHWLESGVKPHPVAPKGVGGNRANRSFAVGTIGKGIRGVDFGGKGGFLKFADGRFAKYARRAGGLPAQRVWSRSVAAGIEPADRIARFAVVKSLRDVF